MIKLALIFNFFFASSIVFAAQGTKSIPWAENVKQSFRDANVTGAVDLLKKNQSLLLKTPAVQAQVTEWFTTFQFDATLSLFEKLQEQAILPEGNKDLESGFKEILEKEPYNTLVVTGFIKILIAKGKLGEAKDKVVWARKEIPFLPVYGLLQSWFDIKEKDQLKAQFACESALLRSVERDFCYYLKVLGRLKETRLGKRDQEQIRALARKTMIPDVHYHLWLKWQKPEDKQKYLSSCQSLSGKQKKDYFFVPEMCLYEEKEKSE
jgi:hypothetical protein